MCFSLGHPKLKILAIRRSLAAVTLVDYGMHDGVWTRSSRSELGSTLADCWCNDHVTMPRLVSAARPGCRNAMHHKCFVEQLPTAGLGLEINCEISLSARFATFAAI